MRAAPRTSIFLLGCAVFLSSCANITTRKPPVEVFPDMDRQPKYKAQGSGSFFSDGRAERPPVPGTVAKGELNEAESFDTGLSGGIYLGQNPLPMDAALLARGRQRYDIYCAPCHDRYGSGRGLVATRGAWLATNLHSDHIKAMKDGELFSVVSEGRRTMPGYRMQMEARDRWAVVAYLRALQRASSGTIEDVPADLRRSLK